MTYYLLNSDLEQRLIIHNAKLPLCNVEGECEAPSWIYAKKALGFELTPLQKVMLAERAAK